MANFTKNVVFASEGIKYFFSSERNGRIQAIIAAIVIATGFATGLSQADWCIILLCIGLVLGLEMVNTSIERICEMLSTDYHPMVKIIKDVSAGAVFSASILSAIIGVIIFAPHFLTLL